MRLALLVGLVLLAAAPEAGRAAAPGEPADRSEAAAAIRDALPPVAEPDRLQPQDAVPGCGERPLPSGPADALPASARAALVRFQQAHRGLGLVVLQDGAIVFEHYAPGFGPERRFQSFSMAKTLTALAIGAAVEDGIIPDERRPLARFLPDAGRLGRVPLAAFLSMSAGLENPPAGDPRLLRLYSGPGIRAAALSLAPVEPPGRRFVYSNASSQIAGEALAAALARRGRGPYARYLSERIWCAIGAAPASLWVEAPGLARFYLGLSATVRDWARVGQLILDEGRAGGRQIVSRAFLARMTAPSAANPVYGYQIWRGSPHRDARDYGGGLDLVVRRAEPFRAEDVLFLDGFGGQRVYVVPSARLVIARAGEIDLGFDDSALVNIVLAGLAASAETAARP